ATLLLRRSAPDTAAEGRDINHRIIPGVEGDAQGIAERHSFERLPGLARILAQPQPGLLIAFADAEIDSVRAARVDGGSEAIGAFAGDRGPLPPAAGCLVQAAIGTPCICRAQVNHSAVARIDVVVLGPGQGLGPVDPPPGGPAVCRPIEAGAFGD